MSTEIIYPLVSKYIPNNFFDTHIHGGFVKTKSDTSKWKKGPMTAGYFFDKGLNLKSLKTLYPFKQKKIHGIVFPIPYGPVSAVQVNDSLLKNEAAVENLWVALRGDLSPSELKDVAGKIANNKKIIGFKLYQIYEEKNTTEFFKKVLYKELIKLANDLKYTLFIHTNSLTIESINLLDSILEENKGMKIVLTHAGAPLNNYSSFSFDSPDEFQASKISKESIADYIHDFEEKLERMLKVERLFVNTALLASEITLYPIFKTLALRKKIIFGTDLPYSLVSRLTYEREKSEVTASSIQKFYVGELPNNANYYYSNLIFLIERILSVLKFLELSEEEITGVFDDMFWKIPLSFVGVKE